MYRNYSKCHSGELIMANGIVRWNPFREMQQMQTLVDRLFEDWRPYADEARPMGNLLALDVNEDDKQYTISTDLPGVKAEHINVRQEGDYLLIDAEIPEQTTESEGQRSIIRERRYGRYSRRLRLPQNIDFGKADANYEDGVLTLTLPKAPEAQPRMISVKSSKAQNGNE
jgi:HSP20 family protein